MADVTLTGDVTYDESSGNTTYGSEVINEGNYEGTGGLIGMPYGALENLKVSGLHVKGYTYVGGVSGRINENTNQNIQVGDENLTTADGAKVPFGVFVEGRTYISGVASRGTSGGYSTTVNYFKNVKVQNVRISASNDGAYGIGTVCQVEDSEVSGCDIYAATSHAAGVVRDWNTVYRTAVKDTKISSGNNVGGIGTYGLSGS